MKQSEQINKIDEATAGKAGQSSSRNMVADVKIKKPEKQPKEYGGRKDGLDPTRYGDWEKNGRCIDF